MRLPLRLEAVLRLVPPGEVVADVGTGHGLLALALIERGLAHRVIATEVARGPLDEAQDALRGRPGVELRAGWGFSPLAPGEAAVLILAGMGGPTICGVLTRGEAVALASRRLVLQPQNRPDIVRRWLRDHGYALVAEDLVCERGRFYPVIAAVPADTGLDARRAGFAEELWPGVPEEILLEYGPRLLAGRHPVLKAQLKRRLAALNALDEPLQRPETPRAKARRRALRKEIEQAEMVLRWLSQSERS